MVDSGHVTPVPVSDWSSPALLLYLLLLAAVCSLATLAGLRTLWELREAEEAYTYLDLDPGDTAATADNCWSVNRCIFGMGWLA